MDRAAHANNIMNLDTVIWISLMPPESIAGMFIEYAEPLRSG